MALARVLGVVLSGVTGEIVQVEVDVSDGLPGVGLVGLPDTSVAESRWRARCAVSSVGATWPNRRVTISLSPAEVRKHGAGLDLPIAIGVLCATGQVVRTGLESTVLVGELSLDGLLRPTRGALAGALAARRAGMERIVVDPSSARELRGIPGLSVIVAGSLADVMAVLRGEPVLAPRPTTGLPAPSTMPEQIPKEVPDLSDVRGHAQARFALEVAAAGAHHVALVGPPGVGKTLLVERLPGVLPDLDDDAAFDVAAIHQVAGRARSDAERARPPFQAPHHSASAAALLGAVHGHRVMPGAITLAHRGVLFLDEAPEFARPSLEGLRQPLESGVASLSRSGWSGILPARFQLVLAANPCPCGLRTGTGVGCSCAPMAVRRYAARLSGPLMDRIDIRLPLARPSDAELSRTEPGECTEVVAARVGEARRRAALRFADRPWRCNAGIPAGELRRSWHPDPEGADLLRSVERSSANLRGPDRVLRLAWSVADLAGHDRPQRDDVAVALGLRGATTAWSA